MFVEYEVSREIGDFFAQNGSHNSQEKEEYTREMSNHNQNDRYVYMVNHTKKDIRTVPVNFVYNSPNIGVVECITGIVNCVKVAWNNLTKYDWNVTDSIEFVKHEDFNLIDYQNKNYVLN
jgi:hypothetical protein